MVFRNDAEHPHLLGSNDIACVAVAGKYYIIIGTFHGAYVLDKRNYDIRHLKEVDDKRVDDIIVGKNGIEADVPISLNDEEKSALLKSANALKSIINDLDIMKE